MPTDQEVLRAESVAGDPVLILDDVFAELGTQRMGRDRVIADALEPARRAPDLIVLDHGQPGDAPAASDEDDAYYAQFKVPDDLVW